MACLATVSLLALAAVPAPAAPEESKAKSAGPTVPDYGLPQVARINQEIRQVWTDNNLQPSPPASDGEWCRRVYLDVLGRIPSVQELREFITSKEADKKSKLASKLLYDETYTEEYARNWTTTWTNILIGRSGGTERNTLTSREGMQKYLRDSFARNKPYDRIVYELVTATGSTMPGTPDFNGATNYLAMKINEEKAAQATAMTSKIFLGLQVQCTQCHNHPFNEWKQQKFWEFNAFFRQTQVLREFTPGTRDVTSATVTDSSWAGESNDASEAILFYELRNGLLQSAFPVFVDGTELPKSGYLEDCNRRVELGKLIVASPFMDKTMANRMWQHFLGYGFTKPIDDLGPHNSPSHPALLDYLGEQFRQNSFNVKELMRWIVLSEPYSLSSKVTGQNKSDDPLLGESPKFTHFYLRQMQAEQLYESLLVATRAHENRGSYEEQEKLKSEWLQQFTLAFGTDEGDEATTFNGTIPQALMMMNGDLVQRAINKDQGSFVNVIAGSKLSPPEKIEYLFEAAMSRKPSGGEIGVANKLLVARQGDTAGAMQDIFWVILNTNEFILQH
ncbi:MAG TPA: DUF1549 and DUF1553 domain-containing protein [Pirellulaceae bacterium]|nr:DUF1549 and DUF1553 domain-containing protein [Pirellulaceae bacterium]